MKELLKKLTATASSVCLLAVCGVSVPVSAEKNDEVSDITVIFDYESDGATIDDEYDLSPIIVKSGSAITIPEGSPERDGFYCSGWTNDNIHAYVSGDTFMVRSDEDITLKPIWCNPDKEEKYTLSYKVEIDGEILDTKKQLPEREYYEGQVATVSLDSFTAYRTDAIQLGWTDGTTEFSGLEKIIIHNSDIQLTPNWKNKYKITYSVGDVDRVVGMSFVEMEQPETLPTDIKAYNTFSRKGFTISGWLCDADNQVYKERASYTMPSQDVTFTAMWTPKEYTVVFKQNSKSANNLKVKGLTDTAIITPQPTISVDGSYFAGWKFGDTIYPSGSEFIIPGAVAGAGITLEAVWNEGTPPETTTTTSAEIPQETTTTTATVSSDVAYGDADESGEVNINDTVLIMQSIANPDKYSLTEQGKINSDVVDKGDGVTNSDALAIQYVESRTITEKDFPITSEKLNSLAD